VGDIRWDMGGDDCWGVMSNGREGQSATQGSHWEARRHESFGCDAGRERGPVGHSLGAGIRWDMTGCMWVTVAGMSAETIAEA
jgi:hypothetical protein